MKPELGGISGFALIVAELNDRRKMPVPKAQCLLLPNICLSKSPITSLSTAFLKALKPLQARNELKFNPVEVLSDPFVCK